MFVRPLVLLCTLTLVPSPAPPPLATKKLDAAACRAAAPREAERLPPEWAAFAPHVRMCDVSGGGERAALTIATVFAEDYYRRLPSGSPAVDLPKPVLLDAAGDTVGRLPFSFPDDPPFALEVSFAQWKDGRPERIELFLRDPTAGGDRQLDPLIWDSAARRFVTSPRK
jgi:hypothetical protein